MERQRLMGTCPSCDGWVFLTEGGKVSAHKRMDFESSAKVACDGQWLPPERLQQVIA